MNHHMPSAYPPGSEKTDHVWRYFKHNVSVAATPTVSRKKIDPGSVIRRLDIGVYI